MPGQKCYPCSRLHRERIAAVLDGLDKEIANLQDLAAQLREQKRGLMQRLFSSDLYLSKLGATAES